MGHSKGVIKRNTWTTVADAAVDGWEPLERFVDPLMPCCRLVPRSRSQPVDNFCGQRKSAGKTGCRGPASLEPAVLATCHPVGRRHELVVRCPRQRATDVLRPAPRARIGAEETDLKADPLQPHQRLGHPAVRDMALGVDAEAVVA